MTPKTPPYTKSKLFCPQNVVPAGKKGVKLLKREEPREKKLKVHLHGSMGGSYYSIPYNMLGDNES